MLETKRRNEETFSGRLKRMVFIGAILAIVLMMNQVLWLLDAIVVMSILTALVPIKFFIISFGLWKLWTNVNKKFLFLLLSLSIFVLAFVLDFETVPELWAYRLGVETQGKAINFRIDNPKGSHFITYQFTADKTVYTQDQRVTIPFYERLELGAVAPVRYISTYPKISFLVDLELLKFQTAFDFFCGIGAIFSLYTSLEEKATAIIKSVFRFKKPA